MLRTEPPDLLSFTAEEDWQRALGAWQSVRGTGEAKTLVLAGVPPQLQAQLWHTALVDSGSEDEASFERAAAAASSLRERLDWDWDGSLRRAQPRLDELAVVSADVPRTLPDAQRGGALDAAQLQRLLDAFVASHMGADVAPAPSSGGGSSCRQGQGYTQGMADVAAWLLMHGMPPWQAFACLHSLVRRPLLRALMGLDQGCWDALSSVYMAHLRKAKPELAAHLEALGLAPFFFLPEWLVALWTRSLPKVAAELAWNMLLVEGDGFLVVQCALGVTMAIAPKLLLASDLANCRDVCRDAPRSLSVESFRRHALGCVLEPSLLRPLAPWVDNCQPAVAMFEL